MPTKKYRVDTDKGSYEVEVEEPLGETHGQGDTINGEDPNHPSNLARLNMSLSNVANPQTAGDFLNLAIPSGAIPKLAMKAAPALAPAVEGAGKAVHRAGELSEAHSLPLAVLDMLYHGKPTEAITVGSAPYAAKGLGSILQRAGKWMRGAPEVAAEAPAAIESVAPTVVHATPSASTPRLAGKAPTLEDTLLDALNDVRREKPAQGASLPSEATTTQAGTTRQSGTFGRSQKIGQPGGYTSGRPSTQPLEVPAPQAGGRAATGETGRSLTAEAPTGGPTATPAPEAWRSAENPEWHSGAEPGSQEAARAREMHQYDGQMDADYKRRIADPRGEIPLELLLAMLAGSGVGAVASHGTTKR